MARTVSNEAVASPKRKRGLWYSLRNTSFGESRSYLFEYGLLLLLVASLLTVISTMIESFFRDVSAKSFPFLQVGDVYVFLLAALTVLLPLTVIIIQRTAEAERNNPLLKNNAVRKVFLGAFLAATSVLAVYYSIQFIGSILSFLSVGLVSRADFDWEETAYYLVGAVIFVFTAWTFGNDYRYLNKDSFAGLRHGYRYAIVLAALITGLLFLVFPFRDNRQVVIDRQIVGDLAALQTKVGEFYSSNSKLPISFNELDLTNDQKQRANTYVYTYEVKSDSTYELCANFYGSSTGDSTSGSLTTVQTNAMGSYGPGRNCYELTVESSDLTGAAEFTEQTSGPVGDVQGVETTADQSELTIESSDQAAGQSGSTGGASGDISDL